MIRPAAVAPRATSYKAVTPRERAGGGMQALSSSSVVKTGESVARVYNGVRTAVDGGKAAAPLVADIGNNLKHLRLGNSMKAALTGLGQAAIKAGQRSAAFAGLISAATNGYRFFKKEITFGTFGGRVVGDTAGGFVGGLGATVAGGLGVAVLGAFGVAGTALTLGGAIVGIVGYMAAENAFRRTKVFSSVVNGTQRLLGG